MECLEIEHEKRRKKWILKMGSSRIMVQGVRIRLEGSNRGTTLYYF
jgi:hypothetical protein